MKRRTFLMWNQAVDQFRGAQHYHQRALRGSHTEQEAQCHVASRHVFKIRTHCFLCVCTPAASFGVCTQRRATTQDAVQIPAAYLHVLY